MANFQKKIEEMQRKLNIINEDIEEIKNGRKSYDKNQKIKINKTNTFLNSYNKRKNFFKNNINNNINHNSNNINNNSINYAHRKNLTNSEYFSNLNNTGKSMYNYKNINFNLTNENLDIIPKNHFITNEINNDSNNHQIFKRDLTINYIDDYTNKKNNNYIKKYKSSLSTINVNDGNKLNFKYGNSINNINKKNETDEYFYKNNSLYQNYCHMKKNLNNINININNLNSSQTINNNNIYKNNKTFNNTIKEMNSFSSIKGNKKIKKILVDKKRKNININKNFFNHEIIVKNIKKYKKNIYNNNHKTIDINNNYSYNNKNLIYNNNNYKTNGPIKIKTRNTNINMSNLLNNSKIDNELKGKSNTVEDINIKNPRSISIENPKVKYNINHNYKYNKHLKLNDIHNLQDNSLFKFRTHHHNHYKKEKINNENKNNHEQILWDIIDITNQNHNSENKVNINNILDEYKILLYDTKVKNEFIYKIINLYNNTTNSNLSWDSNESLIPIWNWIKENQNKVAYKIKHETENKQYKKLCKDIMKEYNLKNIEQLKIFIHKLCKKVDKNENFLEGIKKILLP